MDNLFDLFDDIDDMPSQDTNIAPIDDFDAFMDSLDILPVKAYDKTINTNNTLLDIVHKNTIDNAKITLAYKDKSNDYHEHYLAKKDIKDINYLNGYFSINAFSGRRTNTNILAYTCNFVDLDIEKQGLNKEQVLYFLNEDVFNVLLPMPSIVFDSGNGLWLLWLYNDNIPARKSDGVNLELYKKWNKTQKLIAQILKGYGADLASTDASRVMRNSNTLNVKPGLKARKTAIIENNNIHYDLEDITSFITGVYTEEIQAKKEKDKNKAKKTGNKKSNWNIAKTNKNRYEDLERLAQLRGYDLPVKSYREFFLFVYCYHVLCATKSEDIALEKAIELNSLFKYPITDRRIKKEVLKGAITGYNHRLSIYNGDYTRGGYNYNTTTLINAFDITEQEQEMMITLCNNDIKYKRMLNNRKQARRNDNGNTSDHQSKIDNIYICHYYKEQGLKQKDIVDTTGLTKGTVSKYLKMDKPVSDNITPGLLDKINKNKKVS